MSAIALARLQFAGTSIHHVLLVPLTIGPALITAEPAGSVRAGDP